MARDFEIMAYGFAQLDASVTLVGGAASLVAKHTSISIGASRNTPADAYVAHTDGDTITIHLDHVSMVGATARFVTLALVEDGADVNGDFVNSARTALASGVLAIQELGSGLSLSDGDTFTFGDNSQPNGSLNGAVFNPPLSRGPNYRLVVAIGDTQTNASRRAAVATGATGEFHLDSDKSTANGTLFAGGYDSSTASDAQIGGWFGKKVIVDSITPSAANQGYTQLPTFTVGMSLVGTSDASPFTTTDREVKMTIRRNTGGEFPLGLLRRAPVAANGTASTFPYRIDTVLERDPTAYDLIIGVSDSFFDATIQDNEQTKDMVKVKADGPFGTKYHGPTNTVAGQRDRAHSWLVFADTGHGAGITAEAPSSNQQRVMAARSAIQIAHRVDASISATRHDASNLLLRDGGEQVDLDIELKDAFGTVIDPNFTSLRVRSENDTTEFLVSDNSAPYTINYTPATTDQAAFDTTGTQKRLRIVFGHYGSNDPLFDYDGVDQPLLELFRLSSKLLLHSAPVAAPTDNDRTTVNAGGISLRNFGESHSFSIYLGHPRGEPYVDASANLLLRVRDDTNTNEGGGLFLATDATGHSGALSFAINSTHKATFDTVGSPKNIIVTKAGISTDPSANAWSVSSKLLVHSSQVASSADNDLTPVNDGGISLRNRGETHDYGLYVGYARGDPYASKSVSWNVKNAASQVEDTVTVTTDANGFADGSYLVETSDQATADQVGSPKYVTDVASSDNSTDTLVSAWSVSSLLLLNKLDVSSPSHNDRIIDNQGGIYLRNRQETHTFSYGLGYARGDPYASQTGIRQTIVNASGGIEDLNTNETSDAQGRVTDSYNISPDDEATFDTTGSLKTVRVSHNGNDALDSLDAWRVSSKLLLHSAAVTASTDNDRTVTNVGGISLRNRGETHSFEFYVGFARGASFASGLDTVKVKRVSNDAVEETIVGLWGGVGDLRSASYAIDPSDAATFDLIGDAKYILVEHGGNSTDNSLPAWNVSSKLLIGSAAGLDDGSLYDITIDDVASAANGFVEGPTQGTPVTVFNRREWPVFKTTLSYARGTAYASQSGLALDVLSDVDVVEESLTETTDANGEIVASYEVAETDKATNDATGSPKHISIAHLGNSTIDSSADFAVSSLFLFDTHPQKLGALAADVFPNEDVNEVYGTYVILGDLLNAWFHVVGVRNDTEINTILAANAVSVTYRDPDDSIRESFTLDTGPTTSNGNVNGWTARIRPNVTTPAGDWQVIASVLYLGNSGNETETVTIGSPLTADKRVKLWLSTDRPTPGQTVTVYARVEKKNGQVNPPVFEPFVPDTTPYLGIGYPVAGSPDTWSEHLADTEMNNVVDATPTVNGALYRTTFTAPATEGIYTANVRVQGDGADVHSLALFEVMEPDRFMVAHEHVDETPDSNVHSGTAWDKAIGPRGPPS